MSGSSAHGSSAHEAPVGAGAAPRVAVIGAGISGLTGAYRLRTLLGPAAHITLLDRADRVGGVLRTVELAGRPMDVGAEAYLARRPELPALAAELGLTDRLVHPGPAGPTIRAGGRTTALPAGTLLGIPGSATRLDGVLSPEGLARVRGERDLPLSWTVGGDRALGELLRERFGDEVADRLVEPLLGGVYAGRVDRLGTRACVPALATELDGGATSLTAAVDSALAGPGPGPGRASGAGPARPSTGPGPVFGALRGGYRVLLDALLEAAAVRPTLGLTVRELTRAGHGWRLEVGSAAAPEYLEVDAVLLAVPTPALRRLLAGPAPAAATAVEGVELASSVVVALAYDEGAVTGLPTTSGVLIAAGEPLASKAFTYSANKWPHLAPAPDDGFVRLRASLGRAGDETTLQVPDDELVARVRADLAELTGVTAAPVAVHVQRWGGGLPQYGVGHGARIDRLIRSVADLPGLEIAGSVLNGVGVPACIGTARAAAERIATHLARNQVPVGGSMTV